TADLQILNGGTGYISDLGITGPEESVIGIVPEQMIESFLGGRPGRFRPADGPCSMQAAIFTLDSETGKCVAVEQICVR
ncbi:MAG: YmdB family metallophosphoesterase, partial [Clostridia bacterium]|nr:YmdB family metallophosphoesterase [Clostridia bacterium]